jgi:hypothetical protein
MNVIRTLFVVLIAARGLTAPGFAAPLSYYLPADEQYDPAVPTPEAFMGHEVGAFVVRPDVAFAYARELDRLSDRITSETIGYTHERRPIIALTVTAPENHARLEDLRVRHLPLSDPASNVEPTEDMPVVTWMGFGVHGDEISSMDAAMVTMYHLAAATSDAARARLAAQIILVIPTMNPDGFGRAAAWFKMSRGEVAVTDDQNREHLPGWPRGRGNHYWFDLNRQWVIQTQPEAEAWLKLFHRWKPNLSVDFHEMNADATYFFSPGIPAQVNPYIGGRTRDLQKAIAGRFAATLDDDRDFYFSEEFFDEFNPAMGSNFPANNGGVGYLFENRGFTGRAVENRHRHGDAGIAHTPPCPHGVDRDRGSGRQPIDFASPPARFLQGIAGHGARPAHPGLRVLGAQRSRTGAGVHRRTCAPPDRRLSGDARHEIRNARFPGF